MKVIEISPHNTDEDSRGRRFEEFEYDPSLNNVEAYFDAYTNIGNDILNDSNVSLTS